MVVFLQEEKRIPSIPILTENYSMMIRELSSQQRMESLTANQETPIIRMGRLKPHGQSTSSRSVRK